MRNLIRGLAGTLVLAALPVVSEAGVFVSVSIAPPALPVYVLPEIPGPGYVWTPGYWAWGGDEYYWVPGTWVLAPVGLLWTPGYWGWGGGVYLWNAGYWGPHVGFYGGINYGFGYDGFGYRGGYWRGNEFVVNRTVINNVTVNRVSFNGGAGGLAARPTAGQMAATREHHEGPIPMQEQQRQMASRDRSMRASVNGGRPAIAATPRAGVFSGRGVVAARNSSRGSFRADRPMQSQDRARGNAPARNGFEPGRAGGNPQMRGGGVPQSRGGGVPQSRGGSEQGRGAFQP
ncbi:MAG: YXWGXW repeat-containing protein, partial [Steroidobacteraceae bacterium]